MGNSDLNALIRDVVDHISKLPPEQRPGAVQQIKQGVITATRQDQKRAQDVFEIFSKSLNQLENDTSDTSLREGQEDRYECTEG